MSHTTYMSLTGTRSHCLFLNSRSSGGHRPDYPEFFGTGGFHDHTHTKGRSGTYMSRSLQVPDLFLSCVIGSRRLDRYA
jgi:hypothetical protein